jgi:hypothetical protein
MVQALNYETKLLNLSEKVSLTAHSYCSPCTYGKYHTINVLVFNAFIALVQFLKVKGIGT